MNPERPEPVYPGDLYVGCVDGYHVWRRRGSDFYYAHPNDLAGAIIAWSTGRENSLSNHPRSVKDFCLAHHNLMS